MTEAFKKYLALSVEDKRAADIAVRPMTANRTFKQLFDAGFDCSVDWLLRGVEIGREMLAAGFDEAAAAEAAAAGAA